MNLIYLLFGIVESAKLIKNLNCPACKNCIFYTPSIQNTDFTSIYNKCSNFGNKNIITNVITYDFADYCRMDENRCGESGKYFIEEKNIQLKIWKHKLISNSPNLILITSVIIQCWLIIYHNKKI